MTRKEFEKYVQDLDLSSKMEKKYWIVYEKINQEGSPLTYNQRANLLLGELRNLKKLLSILLLLFIPSLSFCQAERVSDGPYIFIEKDKLIKTSILNGEVIKSSLSQNSFDTIYYPEKSTFKKIKKIAALSDLHGQYDLTIELLKNNRIIDENLNWNFDKGHLVINGDIFDRGDKVNELLWLIYKLEIQAKDKGGQVHYLLGNHEYMILQKDLRYITDKYKTSSYLLDIDYDKLYGNNTVLGRWLRSKPSIIKINDIVFTHGGVSEEFLEKHGVDLDGINAMMRKNNTFTKEQLKSTNYYDLYYGQKGLIWYRGYFEKYEANLTDKNINKILKLLNANTIVVGHTTQEKIVPLFNNRIFGVDSGLKYGLDGEVLIIKNNRFYRGNLDGNLTEFKN